MTYNIVIPLCFIISLILCIRRLQMTKGEANKAQVFKSIAHVFVGGLIGAWIMSMDWLIFGLWVMMTMTEIGAFLYLKFAPDTYDDV